MKTGIIINNIGTPEDPTPEAVGAYLKEFLMDKEIINLPYLLRYALVHWIIVPRRKFQSAARYQQIWGKNKSPLMEITESFCKKLQTELGENFIVTIGMQFGSPNVGQAIKKLVDSGVDQIIFAPMYPQYANVTTGGASALFNRLVRTNKQIKSQIVPPFFNQDSFLKTSADLLKAEWQTGNYQHVVFSFHGLPESQVKKNKSCELNNQCCNSELQTSPGCYRQQCLTTAKLIAARTGLTTKDYSVAFQSRLGSAEWIKPYTSDVVKELAQKNIKNILLQTPSFVADCIETLEEISVELKEEFQKAGGEKLQAIPCVNDNDQWVRDFAGDIRTD